MNNKFLSTDDNIKQMLLAAKNKDTQREDKASVTQSKPIYYIKDDVAVIKIHGSLITDNTDKWIYELFDINCTSYEDIVDSSNELISNKSIKTVILDINSPGGYMNDIDFVIETLYKLKETKKLITYNNGIMASGGFIIGLTASEIYSRAPLTSYGSFGVVVEATLNDEDTVTITNRSSKNKRPDLSTEEGKEVIANELDEAYNIILESLFIVNDAIDIKEGISDKEGIKEYESKLGNGEMFYSNTAYMKGISKNDGKPVLSLEKLINDNTTYKHNKENLSKNKEVKTMQEEEKVITRVEDLKEKYPDLCDNIENQVKKNTIESLFNHIEALTDVINPKVLTSLLFNINRDKSVDDCDYLGLIESIKAEEETKKQASRLANINIPKKASTISGEYNQNQEYFDKNIKDAGTHSIVFGNDDYDYDNMINNHKKETNLI